MSKFIVVSFYTKNSPYEQEIQKLMESLVKLNIPYFILPLESRGSWRANCGLKSVVVRNALILYPDKDVVYIDGDAVVHEYPSLFEEIDGDIGVHYRNGVEMLGGTIFFKNNEKVRIFVDNWHKAEKNGRARHILDQKLFDLMLKEHELTIVKLPATYVQIFDLMKNAGNPVIEHFQASRRFKSAIT